MTDTCDSASRSVLEAEDIPFGNPVDVVLWASRVYLAQKVAGREPPATLQEAFEAAHLPSVYEALCRVLDRLLENADGQLRIHRTGDHRTSIHEQALITGLRCLNRDYDGGYVAAMICVLPPPLVSVSRPDMKIVASALSDMERGWPRANGEAVSPRNCSRLSE